jgi:hypothetical protein
VRGSPSIRVAATGQVRENFGGTRSWFGGAG